jgi:hypothetical protein
MDGVMMQHCRFLLTISQSSCVVSDLIVEPMFPMTFDSIARRRKVGSSNVLVHGHESSEEMNRTVTTTVAVPPTLLLIPPRPGLRLRAEMIK